MTEQKNKRRKLYQSESSLNLECIRDTTKIAFVIEQFKEMGASETDLKNEYQKLMISDKYYNNWVNDLSWVQSRLNTRNIGLP